MIDLTVKTLDSNVYQFSVPDEFTVKQFKQYIAQTVSVAWDKQRIIFGGRVLQDDARLADCRVAGKTVHLVQRIPPPASRGPQDEAGRSSQSSQQPSQGEPNRAAMDGPANNVYVGAFALPHVEVSTGDGTGGTVQLDQMIQQVISSMVEATGGVPQGASGEGGPGINYHVNIAEVNGHQEVHSRLVTVRSLLRWAFNGVNVLEGRPMEEYAVQNPPNVGSRRRDEGAASPSGATATPDEAQNRTTTSEADSSENARPQAERDPRRPLSFLLLDELHPTRQTLAHVYDELDYLNERLEPFLTQYRNLLRRETLTSEEVNAEETRRVTHRVAEVTHAISHVQHLLSDLDIDPRHPANLVVRPAGPTVVGGVQVGGPYEHGVPVRAQINVNTVAILSNGNGNLSAGEARTGQTGTSPGQGMTVGQAAAHAAAHAAAQVAAQAAVEAVHQEVTAQQQSNQNRPATHDSERSSRSFNPADFVRRVSNAAFRSVSRSNSNAAQTPSREETTASNTTTATTQTPTTAGAPMRGATLGASSASGAAFTVPTATVNNQGLRPAAAITDMFDPFLVCDSIFSSTGRRPERQAGRLRFTIPVRSSSVPAAMRRRPMETDVPPSTQTPSNAAALTQAFVQSVFPGLGVFNSLPVASFINREVGSEESQNEFIHDLFAMAIATIRTEGLTEVLQQNYRSLNSLRVPLREFLDRRLLNGEPYSPRVLDTRLGRLVASMSRYLVHEMREADVDPSIDLVATFSKLLKIRLADLFDFIFRTREDDTFGRRLADLNIELIKDLCSLLALCCLDGSTSVERVLVARVGELERHLDMPLFLTLIREPNVRREFLRVNDAHRQYIVRRGSTDSGGRMDPSVAAGGEPTSENRMEVDAQMTASSNGLPSNNDQVNLETVPGAATSAGPHWLNGISPVPSGMAGDEATLDRMEVDAQTTVPLSSNGVSTDNTQINLEPPVSHETALNALRAAVPDAVSSAGSEWLNGIPPGWAPIIARDMGSQSASQRPLSDAYLAGMPSKRRRLMKPVSPSQLSDIPASIQQAIQRAGVRPRTSVDALNADVQRNTVALQGALQSSIRDALAKRLTEETVDFNKDRFPHAHRFTKPN